MAKRFTTKFEDLPEGALKIIIKRKIKVKMLPRPKGTPIKYATPINPTDTVYLTEGYDLLRLQLIVRPFILKKYKMQIQLLELYLYLYAIQLFSQKDYSILPKSFHYRNIKKMIDDGHFVIAIEGRNYAEHIYALSRESKSIVRMYYQYLSGEKQLPNKPQENPMIAGAKSGFVKKRMNLINQLTENPPAPMKKYFQGSDVGGNH